MHTTDVPYLNAETRTRLTRLPLAGLFSLAVLLPRVFAHGGVLSYNIGGTLYPGWVPYNTPVGQTTIERPWLT